MLSFLPNIFSSSASYHPQCLFHEFPSCDVLLPLLYSTSAFSYMNVTVTEDDDDDTRTQFYVRFPSFHGLTSKNKSSIIPRSLKIQNQTTTVKIKSHNIVFILSETSYHYVPRIPTSTTASESIIFSFMILFIINLNE